MNYTLLETFWRWRNFPPEKIRQKIAVLRGVSGAKARASMPAYVYIYRRRITARLIKPAA